MKKRTWAILGATSIIAERFAHIAAQNGHDLLLIGRQQAPLKTIAADLRLRYHVDCDVIPADFSTPLSTLIHLFEHPRKEMDLFVAHSLILNNDELTQDKLSQMVQVNITSTLQLIHAYWHNKQKEHRLIFLSSVAACRGRAKNSLYGASKAAIEIYLEGLQQAATSTGHITIARLGYIDTRSTHDLPGIFYASPPEVCANACWRAMKKGKRILYHPFFWRFIMGLIKHLPFWLYRKMQQL